MDDGLSCGRNVPGIARQTNALSFYSLDNEVDKGRSRTASLIYKSIVIGIADKMKSAVLVQIFCPVEETNRTHSKGYVEDLSTKRGRKRCAKTVVLNLSVLP